MKNIHISPNNLLYAGRMLREAKSIERLGIFSAVELVGVRHYGLPAEERISDGVVVYRMGIRPPMRNVLTKIIIMLYWSLVVYFRYFRDTVACINCHTVSVLPLGILLKYSIGCKLIYDVHELETETYSLLSSHRLISKVVEWVGIRFVDHTIVVSEGIREWYRQHYRLTDIEVVLNCPDEAEPEPPVDFRSLFAIEATTPILIYQGLLVPGRGISILIDAVADMGDEVALLVLGFGIMERDVKERAALLANVHFHPAVPPERMLSYTAGADFGMSLIESTSLSYEYCMPNKFFQYLTAGLPVLVSPTREQRALVERHDVGVVAADMTIASVRRAISDLLARDRKVLGENIEAIRESFSWRGQETKLAGVYRKLFPSVSLLQDM